MSTTCPFSEFLFQLPFQLLFLTMALHRIATFSSGRVYKSLRASMFVKRLWNVHARARSCHESSKIFHARTHPCQKSSERVHKKTSFSPENFLIASCQVPVLAPSKLFDLYSFLGFSMRHYIIELQSVQVWLLMAGWALLILVVDDLFLENVVNGWPSWVVRSIFDVLQVVQLVVTICVYRCCRCLSLL